MLDGQIPPSDTAYLKEIKQILADRRSSYGKVLVTVAQGSERGIWKNTITIFRPLHHKELEPQLYKYDYGDFIATRFTIGIDYFLSILDNLIVKGDFDIDGLHSMKYEGSLQEESYVRDSSSVGEHFKIGWPSNIFFTRPKTDDFMKHPPRDPLVSKDLPAFFDGYALLKHLCQVDNRRYDRYRGSIIVLLPNFQARFIEVRLGQRQMNLTIECQDISNQDIMGKLYCENLEGQVQQEDIEFSENKQTITLKFDPDEFVVSLLSKKSGQIIDQRKFHLGWTEMPKDIILEVGVEQLEELIKKGEGENREFKVELNEKSKDRFVETIVAFSNTYGGIVFIGVDDRSNTIGINDSKLEERIRSMLRSSCEPPIELTIEMKTIEDKNILLVKVSEGKDKPYTIRGRGVFVRSGSTNRIATRYELDRFYQDKQSKRFWA